MKIEDQVCAIGQAIKLDGFKTMIPRSIIIEAITKALRDAQRDTGFKLEEGMGAILLINQSILENTSGILDEICGLKVYSAGYICHISEALLAFRYEMSFKEQKLSNTFKKYLRFDNSISEAFNV